MVMLFVYSVGFIEVYGSVVIGRRMEGVAMRPSFFCWAYETRKSLNGDKDIQICDTILVIGGVS